MIMLQSLVRGEQIPEAERKSTGILFPTPIPAILKLNIHLITIILTVFILKPNRSNNEILLVKENGTYQIIENKLVIDPKNSVIESWSKKNGTDEFGHQLSTQARPLEKVTYFFTKFYFSGIQEWNLVLQAEKPTQRDGPFNIGGEFSNAWYYQPISTSNPLNQCARRALNVIFQGVWRWMLFYLLVFCDLIRVCFKMR